MLTQTLPESISHENENIQNTIQKKVDERGFYLYEWISKKELRDSLKWDYLSIMQISSIPLAIIALIGGGIWLVKESIWLLFVGVLTVLGIFYIWVGIILIIRAIQKSYLYTRGAEVIITDNHYVANGKIITKDNTDDYEATFAKMGSIFREPLFQPSSLNKDIEYKRTWLLSKIIFLWKQWLQLISSKSNSNRNNAGITFLVLVVWFLYSIMMAITYYIGIWLVSILAQIFAWIAHRALLAAHNQEHTIQSLFHSIWQSAITLKAEKKNSIQLLTEAWQNEWVNNLTGRLNDSFAIIKNQAATATRDSIALRNTLKQSKYQEIFNFEKYDRWIKNQILEPINEMILMLKSHENRIENAIKAIDDQNLKKPWDNFWWASGSQAMEVQKTRFEIQKESISRILAMLKWYQEKLQ